MSGRLYSVSFTGTAVTAQIDVFELTPADDKPIEIVSCRIAQDSDAGDAMDELIGVRIIRGFTASGSGGSAATPRPLNPSDAAAGFTAEVTNTSLANTGTTNDLCVDAFNVRAGWLYIPPPEACPTASQGNTTIVVRLTKAPADSLTMHGDIVVRELG